MSSRLSRDTADAVASAQAEFLGAVLSGGRLELYDGDRPEAPEDIPTMRLATCRGLQFVEDPDRPGVVVAKAITPEVAAPAAGRATWFRMVDARDRIIADGTVGERGSRADLILSSAKIVKGARVEIAEFSITVPVEQGDA